MTRILPLCLLSLAAAAAPRAAGPDDVSDLVDEIVALRDEVDPARLRELAEFGNRDAALGLIEVYDSMGSLYMRREVLRLLAGFDGVDGAEEPALEKVANIATEGEDPELREWAVDALAECRHLGKRFLKLIVESPADDMVREQAMRRHVEQASQEDYDWYRSLYRPAAPQDSGKRSKKRGKDQEQPKVPRRLPVIRDLAFQGLVPALTEEELLRAAGDGRPKIRVMALQELGARGSDAATELARDLLKRVDEREEVRAAAAELLVRADEPKIAERFLELGGKTDDVTPRFLKDRMADLLADMDDPAVHKKVMRRLGKGKAYEKLFILRALAKSDDEKLIKPLEKMLLDKDVEVRVAAVQNLTRLNDSGAVKQIEKMLDRYPDDLTAVAGMKALTAIRGDDPEWIARLHELARGDVLLERNAALAALAQRGDSEDFDLFVEMLQHPIWSTRLQALAALEASRRPEAVGAIVARLGQEDGLMRTRFADALWRLTGQPYGKNARAWQGWWEREGGQFEPITAAELQQRQREEEERRLRQVTRTSRFFGIRIESKRVIFIIDVSGSMNELTKGHYVGEKGDPRIEVAKRELIKAIESLEEGTLFNILPFSGGVSYWIDGDIAESDGASREDAIEFVQRLGAGGGTNLYGALKVAFADPDVDSIYVLSDGEPSVGDVIDPATIRNHVSLWNENRGVVVHCIAVGGSLQVLEWLAQDSGGSYVKYP